MSDKKPIGIKELISKVKRELLEEHDDGSPLFAVGEVELQISFTVERAMDGGINVYVVESSAEKRWTDVQTVSVTLEPLVTPEQIRSNLKPEQQTDAQKSLTRGGFVADD